MPIVHTVEPSSFGLSTNSPIMIFVLGFMGVSVFLAFAQALQLERLLKNSQSSELKMRYERAQKKVVLLILGAILLIAGILMPLRESADPFTALLDAIQPLGFLSVCLIALVYVKIRFGRRSL